MSRLCFLMIVVLALVMCAEVQAVTTRIFLDRALVKAPGTEVAKATDAKFGIDRWELKLPNMQRSEIPERAPQPEKISFLGSGDGNITPPVHIVSLIDVTGMYESDAINALEKLGLKPSRPIYMSSFNVPKGRVIKQEPEPGTQLRANSPVNLVIARTRIAIQPYVLETDPVSGEPTRWGQMIVHRPFDIELENLVQNVPMFVIVSRGSHHPPAQENYDEEFDLVEVRAKCIAQRLEVAWDILDKGGHLEIAEDSTYDMPDALLDYRLDGYFAPKYTGPIGDRPKMHPAIFVRLDETSTPVRIMTVYPEDAKNFTSKTIENADGSERKFIRFEQIGLAEYFKAIIEAHHLLFFKMSDQVDDYSSLEICRTREGKIFKEIYLRATEVSTKDLRDVQDALERISMDQRYRLERLAVKAPIDWQFRDSGR
ncbi:MAG: hypothetical protein A2Z25_04045 [Planctomycetes bacterium RBG_16_55_9]|nr:MAG: hypothetical protein A2Z25_04045 [Planctomycetes bacterium RBG_16_55_9]